MSESAFEMLFGGKVAEPETNTEQTENAAHAAAAAEAQERALTAEVDRYIDLVPAIEAARPLPAQTGAQESETPRLSGAAWIADRLHKAIEPVAPAGTRITTGVVGTTVAATVIPPAGVRGRPVAEAMLTAIEAAGNLGQFEVVRAGGNTYTLRRDGVGVVADAWTRHGQKAGRFYSDPESRPAVWDAAGLSVPGSVKGKKKRPKIHEFGEDSRGGTVELELPGGLTIEHVRKARSALRQSLNAPDLEVSERGVHPVLHLNTRAVTAEFPKVNPFRPTLVTRHRSIAEMHSPEPLLLPLGVRSDGSPILINQDVLPHLGLYGGTGSGKTVALTNIVESAALQGEVVTADGKNGRDLRRLAMRRLPGHTAHFAGSDAAMHRVVRLAFDEFEKRRAVAARLLQEGVDYRPHPMTVVIDEWGEWASRLADGGTKEEKDAIAQTVARLSTVVAMAREVRVFVVLSGQHSMASALPTKVLANLQTLVVMGPPNQRHLQVLFPGGEVRDRAAELGAQINKQTKGRGLLADTETGEVQLLQGFWTPPGTDDAARMTAALDATPRLRRFAIRFPATDAEGGDGSWQSWSPVSDPSSDSLPLIHLDREDGTPDPTATRFDPVHRDYSPGRRPLNAAHLI